MIALAAFLLSALTLGCAFLSLHYRQLQDQAFETRLESLLQADQLAAGSDRLTAAVRGYAATGDERYHEDFLRELNVDRTRDQAVERLKELGIAPEEMALIEQAKSSSDALISLENQAIEAAGRHNLSRAVALVFGDEYRKAKASIMAPIAESRAMMSDRLTAQSDRLARRARLIASVALVALMLDVLAILGAVFLFYHRRVVRPLTTLSQDLQELVERKDGAAIGQQNDRSEIGDVARSIEQYRLTVEEAERHNWVKSNLAEIADCIQRDEQPEDLGKHLLAKLMPLMGGGSGAFHMLRESDGRFHLTAGYAQEASRSFSFALGESLPGQAAKDRKILILRETAADYVKVISGLGEAPPRRLAFIPLMTSERVLGVIEIATFKELTFPQRELLGELSSLVALKLEVVWRNLNTRELLERFHRANFLSDIALELTNSAYWHVDYSDPGYYWQSERSVRMLGEEPKLDGRYLLDKEWFDRLVEADPEVARQTSEIYQKAIDGTLPSYDATYAYKRPADGRIIWLHALGKVVRGPDDKIQHMYGVYQDVTELKRLERELQQART